ncbi:nematocin receptor 2-like [Mya arenaria]|uniref:nematocin receptor 2-like n=1 Tax=Mya arenaria TaxID=6604 RepID=UPI0022E0C597|nr:nematocin receptor 2-like [Mya arenaria]
MNATKNEILEWLESEESKRLLPGAILYGVLAFFGLAGNSLVIHVYRKSYQESNFSLFIIGVAAIDLFGCVWSIPADIVLLFEQYTFNKVWVCKVARFSTTFGTTSSAFVLFCISVDRYRKVCKPFDSQISITQAKLLYGLSLTIGLFVSWPTFFVYGKKTFMVYEFERNVTASECSTVDEMTKSSIPFIYLAFYGVLCVSESLTVLILYCLIGFKVKKTGKALHRYQSKKQKADGKCEDENRNDELNMNGQRNGLPKKINHLSIISGSNKRTYYSEGKPKPGTRSRNTTFVMFLVSLSFNLSYLPHITIMVLRGLFPEYIESLSLEGRAAYKIIIRSFFLNCAMNPLIYAFFSPSFRLKVIEILRRN